MDCTNCEINILQCIYTLNAAAKLKVVIQNSRLPVDNWGRRIVTYLQSGSTRMLRRNSFPAKEKARV
jgi:hypothetical protein